MHVFELRNKTNLPTWLGSPEMAGSKTVEGAKKSSFGTAALGDVPDFCVEAA
jgi:hypothetical protein